MSNWQAWAAVLGAALYYGELWVSRRRAQMAELDRLEAAAASELPGLHDQVLYSLPDDIQMDIITRRSTCAS